eukprot:CAMPEP_0202730976 /NCGR_PEP_ID=MMETSP1385-20130828/186910_1 /ASSEMBLY_ACC=CAM_ASM_000861 /TAXON_ID=933848 /ORGANISM="Elphidium margaritaceum" /LENGTH=1173 /DNA_ID=CAMNT_0049397257 /DNA_START=118 /DNA_END=3639 /DNA_ORIENTATION=+
MLYFCLLSTQLLQPAHALNTYVKESNSPNEDIWRSTSDFTVSNGASYGTLRIGRVMSAEFDMVWNSRTSTGWENLFRVGFTNATGVGNCEGTGSRYPSLWVRPSSLANPDALMISVSYLKSCQPSTQFSKDYALSFGVEYHVSLWYNQTLLTIDVGPSASGPEASFSFSRVDANAGSGTDPAHIGQYATVFFSSDNPPAPLDPYVAGDATFRNVVFTSRYFSTDPTSSPTIEPTAAPTDVPSKTPTSVPTPTPTVLPTETPTAAPSTSPTGAPTTQPSDVPSTSPTDVPTTAAPSKAPTDVPSTTPTDVPTFSPTVSPTPVPTTPTSVPTSSPTDVIPTTAAPTGTPTAAPTDVPTSTPTSAPTDLPSTTPTSAPTTAAPTKAPTDVPTTTPTDSPTFSPTTSPTTEPTIEPTTAEPSVSPTNIPTQTPTSTPTRLPTEVGETYAPTNSPSQSPTNNPSISPTVAPTTSPTIQPTDRPSSSPSDVPTETPTENPTMVPSTIPTSVPSTAPSDLPTTPPSLSPTNVPTDIPSSEPPTTTPIRDEFICDESCKLDTGDNGDLNVAISFALSSDIAYYATDVECMLLHLLHEMSELSAQFGALNVCNVVPDFEGGTSLTDSSLCPSPPCMWTTTTNGGTRRRMETSTADVDTVLRVSSAEMFEAITENVNEEQFGSDFGGLLNAQFPEITFEVTVEFELVTTTSHPEITLEDDESVVDTNDTDFWNSEPYTSIFYGAIGFVALLLIVLLICCYWKFKPPKDFDAAKQEDFEISGNTSGKQTSVRISRENIDSSKENMPPATDGYATRHNGQYVLTHTDADTPTDGHYNGGYHKGDGANSSTRSAPSDEDVLGGAYGGHITAGGDDPFPRDKRRVINEQQDGFAPHGGMFHPAHPAAANHQNPNVITPMDMHAKHSDRGLDTDDDDEQQQLRKGHDDDGAEYYDEEEEHEEDETEYEDDEEEEEDEEEHEEEHDEETEYEDDEEEEEDDDEEEEEEDDHRGRGGDHQRQYRGQHHQYHYQQQGYGQQYGQPQQQHEHVPIKHAKGRNAPMTVDAPPSQYVDSGEQAVIEMITKDQIVEKNRRGKKQRYSNEKDAQYHQAMHQHQQEEQARMHNILHDMDYDQHHPQHPLYQPPQQYQQPQHHQQQQQQQYQQHHAQAPQYNHNIHHGNDADYDAYDL